MLRIAVTDFNVESVMELTPLVLEKKNNALIYIHHALPGHIIHIENENGELHAYVPGTGRTGFLRDLEEITKECQCEDYAYYDLEKKKVLIRDGAIDYSFFTSILADEIKKQPYGYILVACGEYHDHRMVYNLYYMHHTSVTPKANLLVYRLLTKDLSVTKQEPHVTYPGSQLVYALSTLAFGLNTEDLPPAGEWSTMSLASPRNYVPLKNELILPVKVAYQKKGDIVIRKNTAIKLSDLFSTDEDIEIPGNIYTGLQVDMDFTPVLVKYGLEQKVITDAWLNGYEINFEVSIENEDILLSILVDLAEHLDYDPNNIVFWVKNTPYYLEGYSKRKLEEMTQKVDETASEA